jgi:hypothetical protein
MAKPRNPKKGNDVSAVSSNAPAGAAAAAAALETTSTEPKAVSPATAKPANGGVRKPEIVKKETRANLVPINLDEEIRRLAYLLSERRGFEPGHEAEDWMNAEREIRERYHQASA